MYTDIVCLRSRIEWIKNKFILMLVDHGDDDKKYMFNYRVIS